jgi:large subunit ribosomal protein L32
MAVPKRRHSKTRGAKRRTNWKLASPAINSCPQCGSKRRPHQVCAHCGHYSGREVVEPSES